MIAFLKTYKLWFFAGFALGFIVLGWYLGAQHWKTKFANLEAKGWESKAQAADVARQALEAQLKDKNATVTRNEGTINELHTRMAAIESDRDFARRLLDAARRAAADRGGVPKANSPSGTTEASGEAGAVRLAGLCANLKSEAERNANRFDALITEITPQL